MNILEKFKPVKLIAMDVDGVLTDGKLILLKDLSYARSMNIKDGYAIQLAVKKGYHILVISGAAHDHAVESRLKKLGVEDVHMGVTDKSEVMISHILKWNLQPDQVLFIGDDIPDISAMKNAGLKCCPADAVQDIKAVVDYISPFDGGGGCVRDIIEKVLKLNQDWDHHSDISSK